MRRFHWVRFWASILIMIFMCACSPLADSGTGTGPTLTASTVVHIDQVANDVAPGSLRAVSDTLSDAFTTDECAVKADFGFCQFRLHGAALAQLSKLLQSVASQTRSLGLSLGDVPDHTSGLSGSISYSKSSASNFHILSHAIDTAPRFYIGVTGTNYLIKWDFQPTASGSGGGGTAVTRGLDLVLNYTSIKTWSLDVFVTETRCDSKNPFAATKAQYRITKVDGLFTGKVMQVLPRWVAPGGQLNCGTAPAATLSQYLNFVGTTSVTKGQLFILPNSTSSLAANYEIPEFCNHFPALCGPALTAADLSAFGNDFCSFNSKTDPRFQNSCSVDPKIGPAAFSSDALWISPAILSTKSFLLPTVLPDPT